MTCYRCLATITIVLCLAVPRSSAGQVTADQAWDAGDHTLAERLYLDRLTLNPGDEIALHRVALIRAWNQRYASSLRFFDRLVAIAPTNLGASVDRARVLAWRGRHSDALAALDSLLADKPEHLPALRARAQIGAWSGDFEDALTRYGGILAVEPNDPTARRNRAQVLGWAGRYAEARAIYDSLLVEAPHSRDALLGLAHVLGWSGQLDSAISVFDRILAEDPNDIEARRGRARATGWTGNLVDGERRWREILDRAPDDVEALVGLAQTFRWQGRHAAALEVLNRARELAPTDRDAILQEQWTYSAIKPRFRGNVIYESDSDGNSILTTLIRASWRPQPRLEISADGYRRTAGFDLPSFETLSSVGASLRVWGQLSPGWTGALRLGVSESNAPSSKPETTLRADLTSPARYRVTGTVAYTRIAFDVTGPVIARGVTMREWTFGSRARLGSSIEAQGSLGFAQFNGSDSNHRTMVLASATKELTTHLSLGAGGRVFSFTKDLADGYFDPDLYVLVEGIGRWRREFQRFTFEAEVAPGIQQVGVRGSRSPTVRISTVASYMIVPGRDFRVGLTYASNGIESISTADADYRYRAINFGGSWMF